MSGRGGFRGALAAAALVALAGCAAGPGLRDRDRDRVERRAEPSAVVAAELAFARAAPEKGQWPASA